MNCFAFLFLTHNNDNVLQAFIQNVFLNSAIYSKLNVNQLAIRIMNYC